MKFFKLCSALTAVVFFGVAVGMFAVNFAYNQTVTLGATITTKLGTGFQFAFGQTDIVKDSNILGTLFAFIFVALGLLGGLCAVCLALKGGKKKKGQALTKLLCGVCAFAVCGVVPAVLLFLTLKTTGLADHILLGVNLHLGVGAILAAVFSLLGGTALCGAIIK